MKSEVELKEIENQIHGKIKERFTELFGGMAIIEDLGSYIQLSYSYKFGSYNIRFILGEDIYLGDYRLISSSLNDDGGLEMVRCIDYLATQAQRTFLVKALARIDAEVEPQKKPLTNLEKLEEEFGDQFLGHTLDLDVGKGLVLKLFLLDHHWVDQVRGVVGDRKFYVRRLSSEQMVKTAETAYPDLLVAGTSFVCIRIMFAE